MSDRIVVLTTCGSPAEARRIARKLVEEKRAACVNIVSAAVESIYRWRGKVDSAREFLLLIKTTRREFPGLERAIRRLHSYEVPEILALPVAAGSKSYLQWIDESVGSAGRGARASRLAANKKLE